MTVNLSVLLTELTLGGGILQSKEKVRLHKRPSPNITIAFRANK